MIHAANRFKALEEHAADGGHMGISIPGPAEINMADMVGWKETIVERLNKGVQHLLIRQESKHFTAGLPFKMPNQ